MGAVVSLLIGSFILGHEAQQGLTLKSLNLVYTWGAFSPAIYFLLPCSGAPLKYLLSSTILLENENRPPCRERTTGCQQMEPWKPFHDEMYPEKKQVWGCALGAMSITDPWALASVTFGESHTGWNVTVLFIVSQWIILGGDDTFSLSHFSKSQAGKPRSLGPGGE